MKRSNHLMNLCSRILLISMLISVFAVCLPGVSALAAQDTVPAEAVGGYYYEQLTTKEARGIYSVLEGLMKDGKLAGGTETVDLVAAGVYENKYYSREVVTADFIAARDAFRLDNPQVFYVDWELLSVRLIQQQDNYRINMGPAREEAYLRDGFSVGETEGSVTVKSAVAALDAAVDAIAEDARGIADIYGEYIATAYIYEQVASAAAYALEADAEQANVPYVRTPYGTLVRGESVCQGYAEALKICLDALGVENILVNGMYRHADADMPHMWNYVRMDDGRWYLLDATMDSDTFHDDMPSPRFFMLCGMDEEALSYQPYGVLSASSLAFEFRYPALAGISYGSETRAFTFEQGVGESYISYRGMGIAEAAEAQRYILVSYDTDTLESWYYVDLLYSFMNTSQGRDDHSLSDIDGVGRFKDYMYNTPVVYAVTDIPPQHAYDEVDDAEDVKYKGLKTNIFDFSETRGIPDEYQKNAPIAIEVDLGGAVAEENKTYLVTITYSEALKKANTAADVGVVLNTAAEGATVEQFLWREAYPNQITFKVHTKPTYNYSTGYYFTLTNLIGAESNKAPMEACMTVVNRPVFACPKVEGSASTVYANTPTLIETSDLTGEGWLDRDGAPLPEGIPFRLSLVASYPTYDEQSDMLDTIVRETGMTLTGSVGYDLTLGLCDKQISYLGGQKVRVLVPFPETFDASTEDTVYKAYHFRADGSCEEIDCIVTEAGLILMCESFSSFMVVTTEAQPTERRVLVNTYGHGTADKTLLAIPEDGTVEITLKADKGYAIDTVMLNGKYVYAVDGVLTLKHEDLAVGDNVLEVTFITASLSGAEQNEGFVPTEKLDGQPNHNGYKWVLAVFVILVLALPVTLAIVLPRLGKGNKYKK